MKLIPDGLTVGDLRDLARKAECGAIKDRVSAVVERRKGNSFRKISAEINRSISFVKEWNNRFKKCGSVGLNDLTPRRTKDHKLPQHKVELLKSRIESGSTKKDNVSAFRIEDIQKILATEFAFVRSRSTVSLLLRNLGFKRLKPRPCHEK